MSYNDRHYYDQGDRHDRERDRGRDPNREYGSLRRGGNDYDAYAGSNSLGKRPRDPDHYQGGGESSRGYGPSSRSHYDEPRDRRDSYEFSARPYGGERYDDRSRGRPEQSDRRDGRENDRYGSGRGDGRGDGRGYGDREPPRDSFRPSGGDERGDKGGGGGRDVYGGGDRGGRGEWGGRGGDFGGRGGGGRGGPGGGRGGPGGGRGGRGGNKKPHMGEINEIIHLVESNLDISDRSVLAVIDPPIEERDREDLVAASKIEDAQAEFNIRNKSRLATMNHWRVLGKLGVMLDNQRQIVRANFFSVKTDNLPRKIFNYRVGIYRISRDKELKQEDDLCNKKGESGVTTQILRNLIRQHGDWHTDEQGNNVGFAYNGTSTLYTTKQLFVPLAPIVVEEEPSAVVKNSFEEEMLFTEKTYLVILNETTGSRNVPQDLVEWCDPKNFEVLHALDVSLLSFARWEEGKDRPQWVLNGSKAYRTEGTQYQFSSAYLGRLGYYASLRCTLSGLALVSEVSVGCFLKGGNLTLVMANVGSYRDVNDMVKESANYTREGHPDGLPRSRLAVMEDILKGCKVKILHLGYAKKFKSFGPAANSRESTFTYEDEDVTVAEYFERMARADKRYTACLPQGRLLYPHLPTVNVGTKKHAMLIPVELVFVLEGQSRQRGVPSDIANSIIKYAAQAPDVRFDHLVNKSLENGVLGELQKDPNSAAFGLHEVSTKPMKVQACILPPAKLQYGNRVIEPQLKGTWNLAGGVRFAHPAKPVGGESGIKYGLIVTYDRHEPNHIENMVHDFQVTLEKESRVVGIPLQLCHKSFLVVKGGQQSLQEELAYLKDRGARLVVALLHYDVYPLLKLVADTMKLPTQCVKWSNLLKPPRNYHTSLLVKMNYKLGGVNHTLASRAVLKVEEDEDSFQSPPKSISWFFDEPCMVMGVDVNHPEIRGSKAANAPSVVAVVGSTDGMLGQFCAKIAAVTSPTSHEEPVKDLDASIGAVLDTFMRRNDGKVPRRIIVYRDGVADNQFNDVLEKELVAYKDALSQRGYNEDYVKIAIVICQKRHQTRLVYQHGNEYLNPCVGLCVDARTSLGPNTKKGNAPDEELGSINTPGLNEFYLNSHAAVLGTSKPCKYTLIYDEIGIKMTELELLTFWMTHLYARCTRSVSYATPAYYAHWAAKRGKYLLDGGAQLGDLSTISYGYNNAETPCMFFV